MNVASARTPRNAAETKSRILTAAQNAFAERGYSQTGMREIAERANVAHSLILRYFGTKANLFAEALNASFATTTFTEASKPGFGQRLAHGIDNPDNKIIPPGMIALALGDDEAREVAASVLARETTDRVASWLGGANADLRATNLMILAMGYAIYGRLLDLQLPDETRKGATEWVAKVIQDLIDET